MNRKSIVLLFLGLVVTVAIIIFGKNYSTNREAELLQKGAIQEKTVLAETKAEEKKEQGELEQKIAGFQEKRASLSLIDYSVLVQNTKGSLKLAFYGDNVENEKWTEALKGSLIEKTGITNLEIARLYFPGYSSIRLANENKVADLVAETPNIVFFMLPVIGNQKLDISVEESSQSILDYYTSIKEQLPDALVIGVTPIPNSSLIGSFNSRTLDYTSYLASSVELLTQNAVPVIDLNSLYTGRLEADGVELTSTLEADGSSLNANGTTIVSEVLNKQLEEPIDTTTGLK